MATLNISIPQEMKVWIENQAKLGTYSNSSDYIRDLVRRDQEQRGALKKAQLNLFGSKVTVVGNFHPIAIETDIAMRGGTPTRALDPDTKYVLVGGVNPHGELQQIITDATSRGIPCISLAHYESQLPDAIEMIDQ